MPSDAPGTRDRSTDGLRRDAHVNVLIAAGRFTEGMDAVCKEEGLTHQQYAALWVLCLAQDGVEGIPAGAVADGLLTRAADSTRLIDRLARAGLVERLPDPGDRRVVRVRATPTGRAAFERLTPRLHEFHRSQWSELDLDELGTLNALLTKALATSLEERQENYP